jgi:hypothetical protein
VVTAAALFRRFEGGAVIFFLGRTTDGLATIASSSGCSLEIVEAPKRGTDVASFFRLSSSLRTSHLTSTKRKRIKDRKD